jgi:tetratricopeptide (TPR) repeat protein
MGSALTSNEEAQLLQTIEMFEVITQSQPMDYQSLEILKEAYSKLSRGEEVIQTAKRIAEAYVHLGQLSSAILEYESILQNRPNDPDVHRALAEIERKANSFSTPIPRSSAVQGEKQSAAAALRSVGSTSADQPVLASEIDDGKGAMQKLFVESKCITAADFEQFWPKPNMREALRQPKEPFIHTLGERGIQAIEKSLKVICEKTRLPFLPIDKYDVDVEFARTFSKETCMRWCVLPFDRMSKSVLISTANPFNKQAEREIHLHSKSQLIWYMASPAELMKVLKKIFR